MVCLSCGLVSEGTPKWALTEVDINTIEATKEFDEDLEQYVITVSPSQIGWKRYWEHSNLIFEQLGGIS